MINYGIIDDSIEFYQQRGFKRIESPWTVTPAISGITKPPGAKDFVIQDRNKVLVASAEQSFLYLYNKGFLPNGMFQSVTPCFRDEPFTSLHTKYFIKNELIYTGFDEEESESELQLVIDAAAAFFARWNVKTKMIKTGEDSYDLYHEEVELGSYGIRKCDYLTWIYGTGVAEPRLTRTIKKYGIQF